MPAGNPKPKPPPDYFSRRVQLRLLVAVASLLLVLTLMFEARKAENWQWMWNGARPTLTDSEAFDTSLPPAEPGDPIGTVYADPDVSPAVVIQQASTDEQRDALRRLEVDAWTKLLDDLQRTERESLDRLLLAARAGDNKPIADDASLGEVIDKMSASLTKYMDDANEAVMLSGDSLANEQKESLLNALREMEVNWTKQLHPALLVPTTKRPWTEQDRRQLLDLQQLVDDISLKSIRDDSFWRPGEQHAWFRWFETLIRTDPAQLQRESSGQVGFLQLFKQSAEYRGKLVSIQGTARLAYRVKAPPNIHGISTYVVYWVKPKGGPNSPIVVYALETPADFPVVNEKAGTSAGTPLNEEVTFTGFFVKRWAYSSESGLKTAPLMVARGPVWIAGASQGNGRPLPERTLAIGAVVAVLALSVGVAMLVFRAGRTPFGEGTSLRRANRDELELLKKQHVLPSPEETLRKLAANDRDENRE